MKNKLFSLILCLLLVCSLAPAAMAATMDTADIQINGNQVTVGSGNEAVLAELNSQGRTAKIAVPYAQAEVYVLKDNSLVVPHNWDRSGYIQFEVPGAGTYVITAGTPWTENRVTLDAAEFDGQSSVWVDGVEYALQNDGDSCYVDLPDGNARTMVTYTYHSGDETDLHTQYPVSMTVWTLSCTDGLYTAARAEDLDDILQYSGMSIRITGKKGIRMITSIEQAKKNALISDGLDGLTLKEYGTAVAWADQLSDSNPLVLGKSYTKSNYAFKKGVADPIFDVDGSLMQYTNVLVNFSDAQCKKDLALRPYMILEDAQGQEITLYGGIVTRSIGYVAYQNRNTFSSGTEAYEYVWNIIQSVYGDLYDEEYAA